MPHSFDASSSSIASSSSSSTSSSFSGLDHELYDSNQTFQGHQTSSAHARILPLRRQDFVSGSAVHAQAHADQIALHETQDNVPVWPRQKMPVAFGLLSLGQIAVVLQGTNSGLKQQALTQLLDKLAHPTTLPLVLQNTQAVFAEGEATSTVSEEEMRASLAARLIASPSTAETGPVSGALAVRGSGPKYAGELFQDVVDALDDGDVAVRRLAGRVLGKITQSLLGYTFAARVDVFPRLIKSAADPDAACRAAAWVALRQVAQAPGALERMVKRKVLDTAFSAVAAEPDAAVLAAALELLAVFVRGAADAALAAGAVAVLVAVLDRGRHPAAPTDSAAETATGPAAETASWARAGAWARVQTPALRALGSLATEEAGRVQCVDGGALPVFLDALESEDAAVRGAAALALMHVTVALKAKHVCVELDAVARLWARVEDSSGVVVANSLAALANLAELPASRASGLLDAPSTVQTLRVLRASSHRDVVRAAADSALSQILWRP